MPLMDTEQLASRLQQLSTEKRTLLALRLGWQPTPAASRDSSLIGFVTAHDSLNTKEVFHHLRRTLPHYMVPAQIVVLDDLPRTPNGKLDRLALKLQAQRRRTASSVTIHDQAITSDAVETELIAIWSQLLRSKPNSPHDNFFELGGHSLLAVRMLAQVKAAFEVDVPISLIVEAPTVANLANYIRRARRDTNDAGSATNAGPIVPMQAAGVAPPLYFLPLHMHGSLHYRHLKEHLGHERPLYGFAGFDVSTSTLPTVEALATAYLDQLSLFQPRGPYYLCGISVAGLIAYEMGRQLWQRGKRSIEVILFDTYGPDYPQYLSVLRSAAKFVNPNKHVKKSILQDIGDAAWYQLDRVNTRWKIYRAANHKQVTSPTTLQTSDPNLSLDVNTQLGAMTRDYFAQPRLYAGNVILYRARIQPWNANEDETLGWDKLVSGHLRVEHVRGDHLGILKRRYVKLLADHVRRLLGQLDITYGINRSP